MEQPLPLLIKQSATYKLFVPRKVEEKIRYLCRKFPSLEWSGVLFTRHTGNFEDGSLEIYCEDIYPMDLGSPGFTEFKMDETVAAYIADNIDLIDCDLQLVHSHNKMSCFFSGTDTQTLREEGNERNCFVSLIVNNEGTYCAAITRKVQKKIEVTTKSLGTSYEFFGSGPVCSGITTTPTTQTIDKTVIEYFMLDVQVEQVENNLAYLDTRFEEIEAKKNEKKDTVYKPNEGFYDWLHSERKTSAETKEFFYSSPETNKSKELTLFSKDTMEEMVDPDGWTPDKETIHQLAAQLLTCSLIVNKDIDLKQWITRHMVKKYGEIFGVTEMEFHEWTESYVEFIVNHYSDPTVPEAVYEAYDVYQAKIAEAIIDELNLYPANHYIDAYIEVLMRYTE